MIEQASHRPKLQMRGVRPLFDVVVVATVAADLRTVIERLRADHARARGVALAERLITRADSPLYGRELQPLREELHRVRDALGG